MSRKHKKIVPLAGLYVLVLWSLAWPAAARKPKIVFDQENWDFGKVKQGETLKHEFIFKNAGDGALNIQSVETSCGCTAALVSKKLLGPGQEGRVQVSFSTAGYGGKVYKFVYLDSDDPSQPRVQLGIAADIKTPPQPRIQISPFTVDIGLVLENEPLQAEVVIQNKGELELVVKCDHQTASFSSGDKPLSFPLKIAAGKEKKIRMKVTLPNRLGIFREFFEFKSNDPTRQVMSFSIAGYITTLALVQEFLVKHKKTAAN
jgi:hypothetical protein